MGWNTFFGWEWMTVWTAASSIGTLGTGSVAIYALRQWSKQEKLKAKKDFRNAVSLLSDYISRVPKSLEGPKISDKLERELDELTSCYVASVHAWLAAEGLLDKYSNVVDSWEMINANFPKYLNGECESSAVVDACTDIMAEKFIFK